MGLHVLDQAIKDTLSDNKKNLQIKEELQKDLKELDNELLKYSNIEKTKTQIDTCSDLIKQIELKDKLKSRLNLINEELILNDIQTNKFNNILIKLSNTQKVEQLCNNLEQGLIKFLKLKHFSRKFNSLDGDILKNKSILKNMVNMNNTTQLVTKLNDMCYKIEKIKNVGTLYINTLKEIKLNQSLLQQSQFTEVGTKNVADLTLKLEKFICLVKLKDQYKKNCEGINDGNNYIRNITLKIKNQEQLYFENLLKSKKCPMCGNIINKEDAQKLFEHLGKHQNGD